MQIVLKKSKDRFFLILRIKIKFREIVLNKITQKYLKMNPSMLLKKKRLPTLEKKVPKKLKSSKEYQLLINR